MLDDGGRVAGSMCLGVGVWAIGRILLTNVAWPVRAGTAGAITVALLRLFERPLWSTMAAAEMLGTMAVAKAMRWLAGASGHHPNRGTLLTAAAVGAGLFLSGAALVYNVLVDNATVVTIGGWMMSTGLCLLSATLSASDAIRDQHTAYLVYPLTYALMLAIH